MKFRLAGIVIIAVAALVTIFTVKVSMAGTTGIISGIAKDAQTGKPLAGANIIIDGTSVSTVTNENGYFVITNVAPGDYCVTAEMIGYSTQSIAKVSVTMDATSPVDFAMTQEAIAESEAVVVRPRPMINANTPNTLNQISAGQEEQARMDPANTRTVPGVLSAFPGVIIDPNGIGQAHLRGGRADQIGYYIEGIPITDPNMGFFATNLFTTGVGKLQLYPGGFGAEYGNAISGVLNEVKKVGGQAKGTQLDTESGSSSFSSGLLQFGGETDDGVSYYVGTAGQQTEMDAPVITEQNYSDNVAKVVIPRGNDTFTVLALQGSLAGFLDAYHDIDGLLQPTPLEKDFMRQRYTIGAVTWSRSFGSKSFMTVQPYYIFSTTAQNLMGGYGMFYEAKSAQNGLQASYTSQLSDKNLVKFGGSMILSKNDTFSYATPYEDYPNTYYYNANVDTFQTALYAQDSFKFSDSFSLDAGLRYEAMKYDLTGRAYEAGDYSGDPIADATEGSLTPRLGLTYSADERTVWKANWGKYTKFVPANYTQKIYIDPTVEEVAPGLGATDPQKSTSSEISYEKQVSDDMAIRVTPFYANYENLIQTYMDMDTGATVYQNIGKGKSYGVEFLVRKKMSCNWDGWLAYTYAKSRVNSGSDQEPIAGSDSRMFYSSWDQRHTITLVANYTNGKFSHGIRADYGSGRADMLASGSITTQGRAKPSIVVTYNMNYDLPKKSKLGDNLYLSIYNIFNSDATLRYYNDGSPDRQPESWVPERFIAVGTSKAF